ncbi:MAG: cell division protein FtsQ/DivIB [Rubrobacteraceae bacterium]
MRRFLRPISLSLAAAGLTAVTVYIAAYLTYPVTGIQVEGTRMLPETKVWNSVSDHASLLTLNAALLERKLKSNSWVEDAEVSKNWRSGIVAIEVEEYRPVLRGEVNGREAIYAMDGTRLPKLGGVELSAVELSENRLRSVLSSSRVLEANGVEVELVSGTDAGGVEAIVDGRRVIFSGPVREEQARALPEIMAQNQDAAVFDLRSPGRIAVRPEQAQERSGS